MTGYGNAVLTWKEKKVHVEIKSLNSKALDLSTRIAPLYREKEMELRQIIAQKVERGKVDFTICIEKDTTTDPTPLNNKLVQSYYQQIKQLSEDTGIPQPNDWYSILIRMPDVMIKTDVEVLQQEEWTAVINTVNEAISQLIDFRKQEGKALQEKLKNNINNINTLLNNIQQYEKSRVDKIRTRLLEGLKQIPEAQYDKNRFEQELIYYIEKLDISEEKQRLTNHLNYFLETMNEGHGQGKKLGFIAQEMGREINTTGSKSNHAEMQNLVVQMKDELEQIKEQVLNVL